MPESSPSPSRPPITDSPWFWLMLFCAACLVLLIVIWPKYRTRQRRLEMQYMAQEEILRRGAEGADAAPEVPTAPPAPGELIIEVWPLALLAAAGMIVAAVMLHRGRAKLLVPKDPPPPGETP